MDSPSRPRRWALGRLPPLFSSQRSRTIAIVVALAAVVVLGAGAVLALWKREAILARLRGP